MQQMQQKKFLNKSFFIIFFLGISSGLPLALVLSTLKAMLLEKGFNLETIGLISLISLPYSLKFCFAPIIDAFKIPFFTNYFGQRRSWILITQIALIISIFALGLAGLATNLSLIIIFSFLVAFFSASQDIVIDGYRIELVAQENQGIAAGFYTYGYRIGMLISGAFALFLADIIAWDLVYFIMAALMFIGVATTLLAQETRKNFVSKNYNFSNWIKHFVVLPFEDFMQKPKWYIILLLIISFKLSDAFAGTLTIPFLLELNFSKTEIATIVKTFGLVATLLGVLIGGILVKKIGIYKSLWIALFAQMFSNLAFAYLAQIGYNVEALYITIFIENFSGGIGDAIFVAYLSMLCNIEFSATQYALLTSFATFARSVLSSSAGIFAIKFGWYKFFIFSTFLGLLSLLFLLIISKDKKDNVTT